ncbi:MAG: hypothetical protein KatS3mg119_1892 [Rhodothalassiaceae bacterium]|nr:MAG: hypothetical protein KatS3mg119_1892 [Rhodothalassiaceae bacterium]
MRARVHALRPGRFQADPMPLEVTIADIQAIAAAYDPERYQAPVVIGHPKTDDPAWGWVTAASARDDGLWLDVELLPEMAELVREGRYRAVSVALWTPTAAGNPVPGVWSLRHLGFLGAQPPAVKGLTPVRIDAAEHGGDVVVVTMSERGDPAEGRKKETDMPKDDDVKLAERLAELERRQAELERREAEAKRRADELARREAELARQRAKVELEQLARDGRIAASQVEDLAGVLTVLEQHDGTVRCAEGERRPAEVLMAVLKSLPERVQLGEMVRGGDEQPVSVRLGLPAGYRADPERVALHEAAVAWMAAHPGTDYQTAVTIAEQRLGRKREA